MPASIAHMLIAKKARENLGAFQGGPAALGHFAKLLERHQNYMALGSLGPDLPYYENVTMDALHTLFDRSDKPMGVDQWSYQLHSKDPNIFPLKMLEGIWRDRAGDAWDAEDERKFAFACGFLSHVAADQTIHPLVNLISGPYYGRGSNRKAHREAEIYQDLMLYRTLTET
jgi:hypothetical protein